MDIYIPIALAAILSVASFYSEHFVHIARKLQAEISSLSAGVFITLIILSLLPMLHQAVGTFGNALYIILLLGFLGFRLGEVYIYQHITNRHELMIELEEFHIFGFFIDHFVMGIMIMLLFLLETPKIMYLILIPFAIHIVASSLSLKHIKGKMEFGTTGEILLSLSPLIGTIGAIFFNMSAIVLYSIFAYVLGALFYLVIRDIVPKERESRPLWFISGMFITIIILFLAEMLI